MERMALRAHFTLWMGFRIFDTTTKLRSVEAKERGLRTWTDLIEDCCTRGVVCHIRVADFDPAGAGDLHTMCWRAVHELKVLTDRF